MNTLWRLVILFCIINCCPANTCYAQKSSKGKAAAAAAAADKLQRETNQKDSYKTFVEGLGGADSSIVRIPFEFKQSALFHAYTLEVIDSVVNILLKREELTLTIDGFAHVDEGTDTICWWLSYNRAMFVRDYVAGRGIDSMRIYEVNAYGNKRPFYKGINKKGVIVNCRAELTINYPKPVVKVAIPDTDEDGLIDTEDKCPLEFGLKDSSGCPNRNVIIVPFETQQATLYSMTYQVLDSVVAVLRQNPAFTISIAGHAYKEEGISSICNQLAKDRADLVKGYLLSRQIPGNRIDEMKSWGSQRPLNAGKNPQEIFRNSRVEINVNRH